jgi:hypothetical protein
MVGVDGERSKFSSSKEDGNGSVDFREPMSNDVAAENLQEAKEAWKSFLPEKALVEEGFLSKVRYRVSTSRGRRESWTGRLRLKIDAARRFK